MLFPTPFAPYLMFRADCRSEIFASETLLQLRISITRSSVEVSFIYGDNSGARRDAWFWWTQVQQGSVVAAYLGEGWRPHTNRDHVLYIGEERTKKTGVHASVDMQTVARAQRHWRTQYARF